jgi:hypothetical protein
MIKSLAYGLGSRYKPKASPSATTSRRIQDLPKVLGNPEPFIHTLLERPPYDQNSLTFHLYGTLRCFFGVDHCANCSVIFNDRGAEDCSVAYLLKERTVEAEKQPLLDNGPYKRSKGTRYIRCDMTQQKKWCHRRPSLLVRAAIVARTVR